MTKIKRALISVSDKTGLVPFAKSLAAQKVEILSTGGTLKTLKAAGIPARAVEEITGFPEIFEGRLKTLHPKIHGGILYKRGKESHQSQAKQHGIEAIDLLVVNLYPFEEVIAGRNVKPETAIENIDIGGPAMLRAAAKNFESVTVVCDPADYDAVTQDMNQRAGKVSEPLRKKLAFKVFKRTSAYDRAIADYFESVNGKTSVGAHGRAPLQPLPDSVDLSYEKAQDLRYGENPHQRAAFYLPKSAHKKYPFTQLHGKELSYNNLLDIEAAVNVLREFSAAEKGLPAACVIKHNNPSGIAQAKHTAEALDAAIECDPMSAFGGILGVNRPCTADIAKLAMERLKFFEVFVAPSFDRAAERLLKERQNLRLIAVPFLDEADLLDLRFIRGGLLVQDPNLPIAARLAAFKKNFHFVTKAEIPAAEIDDLIFAFQCVKLVKSNAIVLSQGRQTVGIGAGQMSRVDAVDIACRKAGYRAEGAFLASDAFFPMPDSMELAAEHKIRAVIQPGGSIKDADVIAACDRLGLAMAFTGERHFRH